MEIHELFLTKEQIQFLTGARQIRRQLDWLDEHGWLYTTSRLGEPRVAREYFHSKLVTPRLMQNNTQPNWNVASQSRGRAV